MADHEPSHLSSASSVTEWLAQLKAGDQAAAQRVWHRFVERLVRLADRKLGSVPGGAADGEDIVLSAFHGFLQGVEQGRFPRLDDRDDLWQVLVMLTERKAIGVIRRETAEKRGGGEQRGESALDGTSGMGMYYVPGNEPTPQFAAAVRDEMARLLGLLDDETLRHIALGKLEGYTNTDLAGRLGITLRAVERKLQMIRRRWRGELP